MKWSSFIVGGIVGITAAAMLNKRRPAALSWVSNTMGDMWSGMKSRGIEKMMNTNLSGLTNKTIPKSEGDSVDSGKAWLEIGQLLEQDPKVKEEADKIMAENKTNQPH